ncbi:hypothetical protein ACIBFB_14480 [Nocardiopsis sp. NPDC050513]|uniref:hypothetical protein n=1 Tax=Nocardiopsis sp. NPDC050513 TaxID=3364338 RepID=UPI003793BCD2
MSNPTVATKLLTLVKGIFGRKEAVPATAPAKGPESRSAEPAPAAEEKPEASAAEEKPAAQETEESATTDASEKAEDSVPEESAPVGTATVPEAADDAPASVEEASPEPPAPATADLQEKSAEIAEEIAVAEAHTEVASDEVLERVRKEAAPSADELAVPTYDDLTLPSIRARLRKLTIVQVRDLRAYEVAHQGRSEFIKMYDNRIAKLESAE